MSLSNISRRSFVAGSTAALATSALTNLRPAAGAAESPPAQQATGTRVGEVTASSAIVWTRLTAHSVRNNSGIDYTKSGAGKKAKVEKPLEQLEGACPGAAGRIRLSYGEREDLTNATATPWFEVAAADDFIHRFELQGLKPGTKYFYASETADAGGASMHAPFRGQFQTAPADDAPSDVRFCVMTCQGYTDRGHADGHPIYPAMAALNPAFAVLTGDLVYYDNDAPAAVTPELARYHWQRMFSLPRLREFTCGCATYWLKDDHDTLANDSWPGKKLGELTYAEGQKIFREQAPLAAGPSYRTFRWGRDLQLWFTDGRDFRSPNSMPDGPEKTIWGAEQKAWFKRTVRESTATWKVLVSPTPLVGPDRKGKCDNHANGCFTHEGDEIRQWIKENVPHNFFVICGDRHWQYHSTHPETGVHEFSVGPASNEHAGGGVENKEIQHFYRVQGGFLSVAVKSEGKRSSILFKLNDVAGKSVYEWSPAV